MKKTQQEQSEAIERAENYFWFKSCVYFFGAVGVAFAMAAVLMTPVIIYLY